MTSEPAPATRDAIPPQVVQADAAGPHLVTTEEPPRRSRAGRNLPVAVAVSVGLGALVLVSLFTVKDIFVGCRDRRDVRGDLGARHRHARASRSACPTYRSASARPPILVAAYAKGTDGLVAAFGLTVVAVLVWRLLDGQEGYLRDVTAGVFVTSYLPLLAGFAMLMLAADDGARRILFFIIVVIASDIGGYAVGRAVRRAPDGSLDLAEEVVGRLRRLGRLLRGRRRCRRARASRTASGGKGFCSGSRSSAPRCSATSPSR